MCETLSTYERQGSISELLDFPADFDQELNSRDTTKYTVIIPPLLNRNIPDSIFRYLYENPFPNSNHLIYQLTVDIEFISRPFFCMVLDVTATRDIYTSVKCGLNGNYRLTRVAFHCNTIIVTIITEYISIKRRYKIPQDGPHFSRESILSAITGENTDRLLSFIESEITVEVVKLEGLHEYYRMGDVGNYVGYWLYR